ncbi:MAG: UDP-N-acetylmuramate--L-alanine ligase [Chloroflexi bacterium]|nr:UDP-N-acetylmuramate--L-alanine ligase [Chloroflexota bacterium]
MSALARVMRERGAIVSGSDLALSPVAQALRGEGICVFEGHGVDHIQGADLVVVSSAVPRSNVEVQAATTAGLPVWSRSRFLEWLTTDHDVVAVAGTHGKTTTTAMVAEIFLHAGIDPSFVVGGVITSVQTNAHAGTGTAFVIEADEYDRTFLSLSPKIGVILNVEHDHPDCYPTFADMRAAFEQFAGKTAQDGVLMACADDPTAQEIGWQFRTHGGRVAFYGLGQSAEWRAEEIRPNFAGGMDFLATHDNEVLGLVRLRVPGLHNVSNAMAAITVAALMEVPFRHVRCALKDFRGVGRRFEVKGEVDEITVIDDYAHHPTAIRATLDAARLRYPGRSLWAVWQPHTFSRTRTLMTEFLRAFELADHVVVLPVYAARESDTLDVSSEDIVRSMVHRDVSIARSLEEAVIHLGTELRSGDVVITLSAGDGYLVGEWLLVALEEGSLELVPA